MSAGFRRVDLGKCGGRAGVALEHKRRPNGSKHHEATARRAVGLTNGPTVVFCAKCTHHLAKDLKGRGYKTRLIGTYVQAVTPPPCPVHFAASALHLKAGPQHARTHARTSNSAACSSLCSSTAGVEGLDCMADDEETTSLQESSSRLKFIFRTCTPPSRVPITTSCLLQPS